MTTKREPDVLPREELEWRENASTYSRRMRSRRYRSSVDTLAKMREPGSLTFELYERWVR